MAGFDYDKVDCDECDNCNVTYNLATNNTEDILQSIVSDNAVWWIRFVALGIVCQCVAVFGVISNTINAIICIRLGLKDPMNVSLLGLSISDFISCFSMVWINLCLFPPFMELEFPFQQLGMHYLFGSWPHVTFVTVTTLITAFVTMERCICVTYPLKVKQLITTKRVATIIVSFYIFSIGASIPVYIANRYEWVFSVERNRTQYSLVFSKNREELEPISLLLGNASQACAFISTIISASILVYTLKQKAKWRQEVTGRTAKPIASPGTSSSSSPGNQASSRDTKVAKMVVMIATIFIASFSPAVASKTLMVLDPELKEGGAQENLLHAMFSLIFVLETINSAFNIFIYYSMSSNYRVMFNATFGSGTGRNG